MVEKKEQSNGLDNQAAKMISQALAEDIGEIPEVSITIDQLKALEQADRKKRNQKKAKFIGIAAALILVCGVAAYAAGPELAVPVEADKNTEQSVEEGDGVVIINEGGAEGEGAVTTIEKDWDKVADKRKDFPDLIIPTYVPDGYEFVQLEIEQYVDMGYKATYTYQKQKINLQLEENVYQNQGESAPTLAGIGRKLDTKHGSGFILDDKNTNLRAVTIYWADKNFIVRGSINENEKKYIRIIDGIDMP